jgi:hypothetical protein
VAAKAHDLFKSRGKTSDCFNFIFEFGDEGWKASV